MLPCERSNNNVYALFFNELHLVTIAFYSTYFTIFSVIFLNYNEVRLENCKKKISKIVDNQLFRHKQVLNVENA